jgi:hypothetical protein
MPGDEQREWEFKSIEMEERTKINNFRNTFGKNN